MDYSQKEQDLQVVQVRNTRQEEAVLPGELIVLVSWIIQLLQESNQLGTLMRTRDLSVAASLKVRPVSQQ